jgi:hypothetical protein
MGAEPFPMDVRLAVFFLCLPDVLPVPHETTFTFKRDEVFPELAGVTMQATEDTEPYDDALGEEATGRGFVSLKFWQLRTSASELWEPMEDVLKVVRAVVPGFGTEKEPDPTARPDVLAYRTVVEAVTPIRVGDTPEPYLERCLDSLDEFVRVFRVTQDVTMPALSRERLFFFVPWISRSLQGPPSEWDEALSFVLATPLPPTPTEEPGMEPEDWSRLNITMLRRRWGDPLFAYLEHQEDAHAAIAVLGDYRAGAVHTATAAEVLFDTLLRLMLWEEGAVPDDVRTVFDDEGLRTRVRTRFAARLGGSWDLTGSGPVAVWESGVARTRHRVVHAGYRPTRDEAQSSFKALQLLDDFMRDRLVENRYTYPKTTLLLLGEPGLRRRKAWSQRMAKVAAGVSVHASLAQFNRWREDLEAPN